MATTQTSVLSMLNLEKVVKVSRGGGEIEVRIGRNDKDQVKIVIHRIIAQQIPIEDGDRVDIYFDRKNKYLVIEINVDDGTFVVKGNAAGHMVIRFNGSEIPTDVITRTLPMQTISYRLVERDLLSLVVIAPKNDPMYQQKKADKPSIPKVIPPEPANGKRRGRPRKGSVQAEEVM